MGMGGGIGRGGITAEYGRGGANPGCGGAGCVDTGWAETGIAVGGPPGDGTADTGMPPEIVEVEAVAGGAEVTRCAGAAAVATAPATAPSATGSSGCSSTVGARPVSACRSRLTSGTRLVPPTRK